MSSSGVGTHAAQRNAEEVVKAMIQAKQLHAKPKSASKVRNKIVTTKRGACGATIALAIEQEQSKNNQQRQETDKRTLEKSVKNQESNFQLLMHHKAVNPSSYWKISSSLTGKVLSAFCSQFLGKAGGGQKVSEKREKLEAKAIDKDGYDKVLLDLERSIQRNKHRLETVSASISADRFVGDGDEHEEAFGEDDDAL